MSRKALLVVDMLYDFLDPGGALYCGDEARKIIPEIEKLIDRHRREGSLIVYITDSHDPDDKEFELFPPHAVTGSQGGEVIPELEVRPQDPVVPKKRYSAFYHTNLEKILSEAGVEEVHLCGVCTSICVMDTVSDLRNRDLPTVVHEKAVADFDPAAHEFALKRMKNILGAKIEA
ncbi:MAG: isochorismatase family cysteine hydrolase [Pseudomonadota bacterium]